MKYVWLSMYDMWYFYISFVVNIVVRLSELGKRIHFIALSHALILKYLFLSAQFRNWIYTNEAFEWENEAMYAFWQYITDADPGFV